MIIQIIKVGEMKAVRLALLRQVSGRLSRHVQTQEDVEKILRSHENEDFVLTLAAGEEVTFMGNRIDYQDDIFCGKVRYDSTKEKVVCWDHTTQS